MALADRQHCGARAACTKLDAIDEAGRGAHQHLAAIARRGHVVRAALNRYLGLIKPLLYKHAPTNPETRGNLVSAPYVRLQ